MHSHFISHAKSKNTWKFIYFLQLCLDYIYKLKFYLFNTTLIYRYNLHIMERKINLHNYFSFA